MAFFVFSGNRILDAILVPTWLHFRSKNRWKSIQKSIPRWINFVIDLGMDFLSIWSRFWRRTWAMLASKIDQKLSQTLPGRPQDALRSYCFDFSASWPHLGTILARFWKVLGFIFEGFGCPRAAKTAKMTPNWPPNLAPFWNPFLNPSWGPNKLARRYQGAAFLNKYGMIDIFFYEICISDLDI